MKKILLTVIIASGLLTAGTAFAGDSCGKGKRHGGFGKHGDYQKMYRKLDLSDEQKQQIKAIFKQSKPKDKATMLKKRQQRLQDRMAIIQAEQLDYTALNNLADQQANDMRERFVKMAETQHAAWKVLTPEQQKEAKAMQEKRMNKMQKRLEKRQRKQEKRRDKKVIK